MPKWMSAIDSMTAGKALGLGFSLAAVNPKNLLMAISAGLIVGGAGLTVESDDRSDHHLRAAGRKHGARPGHRLPHASARLAGPLDKLREWLVDNNAVIMAILLLVIGVSVIGKGLANFQG